MTITQSLSEQFTSCRHELMNHIQAGRENFAKQETINLLHLALQEQKRFKVLVLDQFANLSPYALSHSAPIPFEELCTMALRGEFTRSNFAIRQQPEIRYVDETFRPEFATTTFRAREDGSAEIWLYRWDSSG